MKVGDYCETPLKLCKVLAPEHPIHKDKFVYVQFNNGKSGWVANEGLKQVEITDCNFNGTIWEV